MSTWCAHTAASLDIDRRRRIGVPWCELDRGCRTLVCVGQYAIITQQVVGSMLRSEAMGGAAPHDGAASLDLLLLQAACALLGCSTVHGVRLESQTSTQLYFICLTCPQFPHMCLGHFSVRVLHIPNPGASGRHTGTGL